MVEEKIQSRDEKIWTSVQKTATAMIEDAEDNLKIQKEILALANKQLWTITKCQKK